MRLDDAQWWPEHKKGLARILRYQFALKDPIAILRMETTAPGDLQFQGDSETSQLGLRAEDCRQLAEHLLRMADVLDRHERPMQ